jgi:hypothetical protein
LANRILTGEDGYGTPQLHEHLERVGVPLADVVLALHDQPDNYVDDILPTLHRRGETDETTTHVYVNHGRWVVGCPFCTSAQLAMRSDPRFLCAGPDGCFNATIGGAYARVVWPDDPDAIAAQLLRVPEPPLRNWLPHEDLDELAGQVRRHLGEPDPAPPPAPRKPRRKKS